MQAHACVKNLEGTVIPPLVVFDHLQLSRRTLSNVLAIVKSHRGDLENISCLFNRFQDVIFLYN